MPSAPSPPAPAWLDAIDPALVARLRRPLDAAGIIPLSLLNRIMGWAQYFSGRLPMLEKLSRRRGGAGGLRAGDVPIVHARFAPPPPEGVMSEKVVVERMVVRAVPPAVPEAPRDSAALAQLAASVPDRGHGSV